jgi:hypothetical protein
MLIILIILIVGLYFFLTKKTIKYYIEPSSLDPNFVNTVNYIICNSNINKKYTLQFSKVYDNADIIIKLMHRDNINKIIGPNYEAKFYPSGKKINFSYTWYTPKLSTIGIDHLNWLNGVPESQLDLDSYRNYVIQHELMHGLGYDHQECDLITKTCPIMYQATKGLPEGYRYINKITSVDYNNKI